MAKKMTNGKNTRITVIGFDAYVTRNGTTNTSVEWVAIGYKAKNIIQKDGKHK